jgi:hypothetical protein
VKEADKKLLWDFFGPHAERTASHFSTHLSEFLAKHQLSSLVTGRESAGEGHQAVYCLAAGETFEAIRKSLRPNRVLEAGESVS